LSTTPEPTDLSPVTVRVTHPFHPRFGQELEFVKRLVTWRVDRVFFFDEAGALGSLPAEWTDLAPPDGFVVVAHGRFGPLPCWSWPTAWPSCEPRGQHPVARVSRRLRHECQGDHVIVVSPADESAPRYDDRCVATRLLTGL
jgi:hypothetical protein